MRRVIYRGKEYVRSRERGGFTELVDVTDGSLVLAPSSDVVSSSDHHIGVLASLVPFSQRPREFLDELRQRRRVLLEEHQKARARDLSKGSKPRSRSRGKNKLSDMEILMAQ